MFRQKGAISLHFDRETLKKWPPSQYFITLKTGRPVLLGDIILYLSNTIIGLQAVKFNTAMTSQNITQEVNTASSKPSHRQT